MSGWILRRAFTPTYRAVGVVYRGLTCEVGAEGWPRHFNTEVVEVLKGAEKQILGCC